MSNEEKIESSVEITLLGKSRKLRYTMYSLLQFKKATGKNLLKGGFDFADPEFLVFILWVGLISDDKSLRCVINDGKLSEQVQIFLDELALSLNFYDFEMIVEKVNQAIEQMRPKDNKDEGSPAEKKS